MKKEEWDEYREIIILIRQDLKLLEEAIDCLENKLYSKVEKFQSDEENER